MNPAVKRRVHVVVTDRKQLHCGLEDNVPFPEYYTAEVKNRYDYYPFGMLMEERKYAAPDCRYDIDTSFIATVMDQNFEEDPTLDAWLYVISSATPNYGSGSMLLDYDQDPLITYWPADEGDRYKVTFSFSFEGDCDSLQVLGNVQNSTTQSYTSGGTYTFDFTVNDMSGGYGIFGFYKDNPDCIVYIHSVKIEQYTTSTQVVCDTDSVAGYRYGFNGKEKIDEQYGIEGTAYDFGARLYDSRLGRWMAVDPLEKYFAHLSPYSAMTNNPIYFIDKNGEYFTGAINEVLEVYSFVSILAANGNKEAQEFKAMLEEMDASDVEFNIQIPFMMNRTEDEGGYVTFDVPNNRVSVVIYKYYSGLKVKGHSFRNRKIHELTHGFQFLKGKIDFLEFKDGNVAPAWSYDLTDEQEAFKKGRLSTDNDQWEELTKKEADRIDEDALKGYEQKMDNLEAIETDIEKTQKYESDYVPRFSKMKKYISVFNYQPTEKQKSEKKQILK